MATVQLRGGEVSLTLTSSEKANMLAIRRDHQKNVMWMLKHYDELLQQFPDEYVAVYDEWPVAHAKTILDLSAKMSDQHIDPRSVAVRKITKKTEQLIL
jgi:hypothetical protein